MRRRRRSKRVRPRVGGLDLVLDHVGQRRLDDWPRVELARLCGAPHSWSYAELGIMRSWFRAPASSACETKSLRELIGFRYSA